MLVYNILFLVCLIIALPFLLIFMPKNELRMRLSINGKGDGGYLWFHCASIGELNAVKPLLVKVKQRYPNKKILMTTMTVTGYESASTIKEVDETKLLPFDLIILYKNFFKRFSPQALIIVETELWFSLLSACRKSKIPVAIVNGRISDKSYSKYLSVSKFVKKSFRHASFVGAQSEEHQTRYLKLGFENVHNTHNLKFCTQLPEVDTDKIRAEWKIKENSFIVVWGSSRDGEEELLLSLLKRLKRKVSNLLIILAPRHLNRLSQITELLSKTNYRMLSDNKDNDPELIIIDSIGQLYKAYAIADVAIIGGSFIDYGGHNPLEPIYYKVPTIIGQHHSSCRDLVQKLLNKEAIIISNKRRLLNDVVNLAKNRELRQSYGNSGKETIDKNACSVQLNLDHLEKSIGLESLSD